jgi:tryptophan synthase alpha subunit
MRPPLSYTNNILEKSVDKVVADEKPVSVTSTVSAFVDLPHAGDCQKPGSTKSIIILAPSKPKVLREIIRKSQVYIYTLTNLS